MIDSEKDAGQKRSRTVKSEVVNLLITVVITVNIQINRDQIRSPINYCRGNPDTRHFGVKKWLHYVKFNSAYEFFEMFPTISVRLHVVFAYTEIG
jgi:hypothetical protein